MRTDPRGDTTDREAAPQRPQSPQRFSDSTVRIRITEMLRRMSGLKRWFLRRESFSHDALNRLTDAGVLEIAGLVDPEAIPGHRLIMVGVKLSSMDLVKKGEEFSRLRGVVSVSVVTGRFDLILIVLLKEGFGLLEFYTEEVATLKDVQSVETFVVYKGYNMRVPYIL